MKVCRRNKGHLGLEKGSKNIRVGIPEIKCYLGDTRVGGRMILEWVLEQLCFGLDLNQVARAVSSEESLKTLQLVLMLCNCNG
jgi:hypothetical protein